jgi:hypothetical protein
MDDLPQDGREAISALKALAFLMNGKMLFSLEIPELVRLIWQLQ